MVYKKPNGTPMSKQEALCDTLRRQSAEMRAAKTAAEKSEIQRKYAAERQNILRNYTGK